jgi:hypothetical protein
MAERDNIMRGVTARNVQAEKNAGFTPTKNALLQAREMVFDGLSEIQFDDLTEVLASRRRVTKTLDGNRNNTFFSSYFTLDQRMDDIGYDLESFRERPLRKDSIRKALQAITRMETAFYPYAEVVAKLFPNIEMHHAVDRAEIESTAKTCIERAVWDLWTPTGQLSPEETFASLERLVKGYLFHLPQIVRRTNHGEGNRTIVGIDKLNEFKGQEKDTPWEERFVATEQENGRQSEYETAESIWYSLATQLRLPQAFFLIEQLPPRLQLAMLDRFGYINPHLTVKERLRLYGMANHHAFVNNFSGAIREILKNMPDDFTGNEQPRRSISAIIGNNELTNVYRMNQRVLHYDSPRLKLRAMRDDPEFIAKLSPKERQVFFLATETDDSYKFRHSNEEIAQVMGHEVGTIEGYITKCLNVASSEKPRFPSRVNKGGSIILENSAQHKLILTRSSLTPEQLAALSPQQRQLLDYLTTPDSEGIYPRESDAAREINVGTPGMTASILRLIEKPHYILDLKQRLEMALAEPNKFTPDQLRIMHYIIERIRSGSPLRSRTNDNIGWKAVAVELGLPAHIATTLDKKLQKIYPRTEESLDK